MDPRWFLWTQTQTRAQIHHPWSQVLTADALMKSAAHYQSLVIFRESPDDLPRDALKMVGPVGFGFGFGFESDLGIPSTNTSRIVPPR